MKQLIKYALLIAWVILCVFLNYGCVQLIHEQPDGSRLKINSLFNSTAFDGFYYDPNGFLEVNKYIAIPADMELQFDPLTKKIVLKAKASKI